MEKYILELISQNNRVIIPNFGAFIISKEQGASILFNNFLSFNDGLLVNYVAKQKDIDTIIATDQVFEYVDKLKRELDEAGVYDIKRLGTFKKDSNGILRFQQAEDFADLLGEEAEPQIEEQTEPEKKVFVLDVDRPADEFTEEKPEKEEEKEEEKQEEEVAPITQKKIIVPPSVSSSPKENVEDKKVQLKKPEPVDDSKKKKNNSGLVIFLIIVAIIVIGIGVFLLWFKKPKQVQPAVVQKEIEVPVSEPAVEKDTIEVVPEVKPEPQAIEHSAVHPMKGQIHIIVGGFAEAANAHNMVDKLKKQGYSNAQVITKGNMNLVSIDWDTSYRKIEARQQEILEQKIESWLYTIK